MADSRRALGHRGASRGGGRMKACSVAGCDKPHRGLGYCQTHYWRVRRHGSPEPTRNYSGPQIGVCPVEGCDQPKSYNGMCKKHATRVARHGDPNVCIQPQDRNVQRGAAHHSWTGKDASYFAMHQRVDAALGPASKQACVDCRAPARHWSYDRSDPDERTSDLGPYSTKIEHYAARCVSCHKRFDLDALKQSARPAC